MLKRLFDLFFSFWGLVVLSPLFIVIGILIKLDSQGPVFFRQERIGRYFKPFKIYKLRTMIDNAEDKGSQITVSGDKRITRIGKFLRKHKLDEFPQLINVLKGEMSFVGPRPEVRKYVEIFKSEYEKLLRIRPGITDFASMKYSTEEIILSRTNNWEEDYIKRILPEKINLSMMYMEQNNDLRSDLYLIFKTFFAVTAIRNKIKQL